MGKIRALAVFGLLMSALAGCAYYHVVQPGDTLYNLSKEYGVSVQDIQQQNPGIDPYNLQPGDQLKIPRLPNQIAADAGQGKAKPKADQPKERPKPAANADAPPAPTKDAAKQSQKPRTDKNTPLSPAPAAAAAAPKNQARFIWPVAGGKVTARFGDQEADGVVSHGMEISATDGAPVLAAADGKVILASDQFKGYGNMIVVRHSDNFFTIYSFNKKMLVKKGDDVKRGQQIAEVGQTGRAVTPTLHFQVRIGSKAVDPLTYLPPQ